MKGTLFVGVYSMIMIGLFIVCCYLMTIVDPKPLPIERRRLDAVPNIYPRDPLPLRYSIAYGLEKIPEGVDADEFRKKLSTTKYNYDEGRASVERGQRVVPPIWPREVINEKRDKVMKTENKLDNSLFETSPPAKGLRRSINNNKIKNNKLESSGLVRLKVINEGERQKIEIKFISREKCKEKEIKLQLSNLNTSDSKEMTLQLRANDTIVLTIGNVSDVLFDESVLGTETESTVHMEKNISNSADKRIYSNKTLNNTKPIDLQKAENELTKRLMDKEIYSLNLLENSDKIPDGNPLIVSNRK